jgi:hypothetical protein
VLDLERFHADGVACLRGAFDPDAAVAMRAAFWREMARRGISEADASTWPTGPVSHLQNCGKHSSFDAIGSPVLAAAMDALLGEGTWSLPHKWGQVLVTFPRPGEWTLPTHLWHLDHPYGLQPDPLPAVHVFACFGTVEEHGGGTLALAGSHHLVRDFVAARPSIASIRQAHARLAFTATAEFKAALADPARVVEFTGEPGDVWLMHPLISHHGSDNVRSVPRLVRHVAIRVSGR